MAVLKEAADVKSVVNAQDLVKFLQSNHRLLSSLPDLKLVANLLLVMAATNAVSERSFSALKLIKTYLRSTQTQERLNNVMTLYVLKDLTDSLNMVDIANEFFQEMKIVVIYLASFQKLISWLEVHRSLAAHKPSVTIVPVIIAPYMHDSEYIYVLRWFIAPRLNHISLF